MAFSGQEVITARILNLLGPNGEKIVGWVDGNGQPRFDFYSGSAQEQAPGFIATNFIDASPDFYADLQIKGPDMGVGASAPFIKLSSTFNTLGPPKEQHIDMFAATLVRILVAGLIFNPSGILGSEIGRAIRGVDGGTATANTTGGNGTLDYPHSLGNPGTGSNIILAIRSGAVNSYINRFTGGDTNTTFQCRAELNAGGSPANGTAIGCVWLGIQFV